MFKTEKLYPFSEFYQVRNETIYASPRLPDTFTITLEVPNFVYNKMSLENYRIFVGFEPEGE